MAVTSDEAARKFGAELRRLRLQAGYSQQQLADMVPMSQSAVSDIERGRTPAKRDQAERIDQVLTGGRRLIAAWEAQYDGYQAPAWVREVSELESRATEIKDYHPLVVPGLLQTEEYARATIRAGNRAASEREIGTLVTARMKRQRIFTGEAPPRFLAVVDESVFRRPTGGRAVMKAQVEHLLTMADNDRVDILVVPLATTQSHPGLDGPFRLVRVPEVGEILWREVRRAGGPVESPDHVADHVSLFAELLGVALPADASSALLAKIKGEIT